MNNIVYIDAANMIMSANSHNLNLDILKLKIYLIDKYKMNKFLYFTAKINHLINDYEYLKANGFELIFKEKYNEYGKTKANCDVEISHRITKDAENDLLNNAILITGDGDFASLLDYLNKKINSVKLIAIHTERTSKLLKIRRYLEIVYISDILEKKSPR